MSHHAHHRGIDYAGVAKLGFVAGVVLFAAGGLGEIVLHSLVSTLPAWSVQMFFTLEVLGVVVGLLVPLVYGIVLPLTE